MLAAGSPATAAGPLSPPLRMSDRELSRRPPLVFSALPWQLQHFSTSSGRTLFSKNSPSVRGKSVPPTDDTAGMESKTRKYAQGGRSLNQACRSRLLRRDQLGVRLNFPKFTILSIHSQYQRIQAVIIRFTWQRFRALETITMHRSADPSRDLLFGVLSLQNGLIDQSQLVAAFQAWTRDKSRPLAEHLLARGDLDADQRAGVEAMVSLHLKKHGGDAEKSL